MNRLQHDERDKQHFKKHSKKNTERRLSIKVSSCAYVTEHVLHRKESWKRKLNSKS